MGKGNERPLLVIIIKEWIWQMKHEFEIINKPKIINSQYYYTFS